MITENKGTRNVWGFSLKEFRLYCFSNKAERTKYLSENKDVEELQAQDCCHFSEAVSASFLKMKINQFSINK
jgi:hypothetical protein